MKTAATITPDDLAVAGMLFASTHREQSFAARDFTQWMGIAAVEMEEEQANEVLLDLTGKGFLREVGPGVYANAIKEVAA